MIAASLALLITWPVYQLGLAAVTAWDAHRVRLLRRRTVPPTWHEPETFWIIVPCLNEELVVGNTVRAALALAGPEGTRTGVVAVDDGSDDATPEILAAIDNPRLHVLTRTLPDARRGKGEALNAAYRWIMERTLEEGGDPARVAVGVIDGDGRGSPNLLREVSRALRDPRVGGTQCRVRIHNRTRLLAAVQDLEFASIVNANQAMRNVFGSVGLGGNGQFTRLSALAVLGDAPWSRCLVEDLELGLRMHLAGMGIRYLSQAAVTQQGLVDSRRLLRQRTRWAQGNLQCIRYVPQIVTSRLPRLAQAEMLYYLLSPWANAIGCFVIGGLWSYAAVRLLMAEPVGYCRSWFQLATALTFFLVGMLLPAVGWAADHRLRMRDERLGRLLVAAVSYPTFLFLTVISTVRAFGRHMAGRQSWAKTERLVEAPVVAGASGPNAAPG